jgi:ubiquitin carboxyl-terminal hydrolase 47
MKLNDRVAFPKILDLNAFAESTNVNSLKSSASQETAKDSKDATFLKETDADGKKRKQESNKNDEKMENEELPQSETSKAETKADVDLTLEKMLQNGPYVYELYSVLVHRGSAIGGHYYAYIKSFSSNKWYEFNDSCVEEISEAKVETAYGQGNSTASVSEDYSFSAHGSGKRARNASGASGSYQTSDNAYMLMYRMIEPKKNAPLPPESDIPDELRKKIEEENKKSAEKEQELEKERELIKLKIYFQGEEKDLKLNMNTLLKDTVTEVAKLFGIDGKIPDDCLRLRGYQPFNDLPAEPYDQPQHLSSTLQGLHFFGQKALLLETKEPDQEFAPWNPSDMLLRVIFYHPMTKKFSSAQHVYVVHSASLLELKKVLEKKFDVPIDKQRIVKEPYGWHAAPQVLVGDDAKLKMDLKVFEASKIYLEHCEDFSTTSPCFEEIERTFNLIEVNFLRVTYF